jgi:NADH-quinone oxidoreductase subunit M
MPVLTVLWAVPMIGAVVVMLIPAAARQLSKYIALATSFVVLAISAWLAIKFDPSGKQYQFVEDHAWIPSFGTGYILGIDGIALALVVLTAVLVPILIVAGWNDADEQEGLRGRSTHTYLALTLAVEGMVLISLVALDVLLFYVFFEAMLIPMYFLIGGFGGENRSKAAVKFLLYNLFGGLIMLAAVIGLYVAVANSDAFAAGTFDFRAIVTAVADGSLKINPGVVNALFGGFMFAFAIKAPLWPFHRWLPDAAVEATPATAVLMMAVVDKVGTFGMLRYCLQLFPDASMTFRPLIITLAVIGIVYGAIVAIGQTDVMRLISYTSISHFGFIILGIFVMTSQGQAGSTLYMVNHGISTAALFLIAGFLVSRKGSRLIADYGGVQKVAPILAGTFLVAGLATLSLPGLAPFISEFLVLIGTFTRYPVFTVFAATGLVLSAIYILLMYQRMMTGPVNARTEGVRDLRPRELFVVVPLIAILIALGVYPKPALSIIDPAVGHTLTTIDQHDPAPRVAEGREEQLEPGGREEQLEPGGREEQLEPGGREEQLERRPAK